MQEEIQSFIISYWFKKLDYNPADKIDSLTDSIKSVIDTPLMYNNEDVKRLFSMPRIEGISSDKKNLFSISLINATIRCEIKGSLDNDEVTMLINNYSQLFFDILKDVYNLDILYTSIKLEMTINNIDSLNFLKDKYHLSNNKYEDLSFKRGFIKDNYYINYIQTSGKEYNFNVEKNESNLEQDLYDQTFLIPIIDAHLNKEYLMNVIEINDRYSYNNDRDYRTKKDIIRGMILEIKDILKNKKYL